MGVRPGVSPGVSAGAGAGAAGISGIGGGSIRRAPDARRARRVAARRWRWYVHRVLKEAFQDLNRLRQIVTIAARHGFGAYFDQTRLGELLGGAEAEEVRRTAEGAEPAGPEADRRTAQRFRQLLLDLGPSFIKLGQLLSSRPDIPPSHWVDELS